MSKTTTIEEVLEDFHLKGRKNPNGYGEPFKQALAAIEQLVLERAEELAEQKLREYKELVNISKRKVIRNVYYKNPSKKAAYTREYFLKNKDKINEARRRRHNPEKVKARAAVNAAVRDGKIDKPTACPKCGEDRSVIDFHHTNGYAPEHHFSGEWLCRSCHGLENRRLNELARGDKEERAHQALTQLLRGGNK